MISIQDTKIITKNENVTIVSGLIDGIYPNVEKLIPQNTSFELNIDSTKMINLIDRVTVISNEGVKIVKLSFSGSKVILESKKDEIGDAKIEETNIDWKGDDFSIVFNATFFKEAVKRFKKNVKIQFSGELKPFIIRGEENPKLIHIVLPHRNY